MNVFMGCDKKISGVDIMTRVLTNERESAATDILRCVDQTGRPKLTVQKNRRGRSRLRDTVDLGMHGALGGNSLEPENLDEVLSVLEDWGSLFVCDPELVQYLPQPQSDDSPSDRNGAVNPPIMRGPRP